jgi:hypothetical protein
VAFFPLQKSISFLGEKLPNLRQSKKNRKLLAFAKELSIYK